ncbi:hypothetical protein D9V32_15785 [Mycetocola tolaasinivorans]|uniref:Uncharacterized protein n=1 Tax=Mycetocola tolaasinivorans TaxID=76635 RepID=A0A3L6ZVK2_9MICO|nr:hypothetical protein [Mycetocola tolaasinivorans]RLP71889.1 hypothetical protein D9V32_15785 [Mycetocola tolaasinivorans]
MFGPLEIETDRDSVAMGDDAVSHARQISVRPGIHLAELVEQASPEIREHGWSWVARVDGEAVAVWSIDHGARLLRPDRRITRRRAPKRVHFDYYVQIDPEWLHQRLSEGAAPNRLALEAEFAPIAQERWEIEQRRREREIHERLFSAECVDLLRGWGAVVNLHNDRLIRFELGGARWSASRADTMVLLGRGGGPNASIRPASFAECWLAAAVGADYRVARGAARMPEFDRLSLPELEPMASWPPGTKRWATIGALTVQLSGEDAVSAFELAHGRSLTEIADLIESGLSPA